MKKIHFIFELAMMSMSLVMLILLMLSPSAMLVYFLGWQIILVTVQFIHALLLTYHYIKVVHIWHSLRIYWLLMVVFLLGVLLRDQPWLDKKLSTFIFFVIPWFAAIYLTMVTYRIRSSKEETKNQAVK